MVQQSKYLEVRFNPDGTFNAKMLLDRVDAVTIISALIRHFSIKDEEIQLSNKLDKILHGKLT